jgi:hypothetical protein
MSKIWKHPNGSYNNALSHYETLAIQRLGIEFYRANSSFVFKGSSLRVGCYRLFHQMDQSYSFEEYDTKNLIIHGVIEFITEHIIHRFSIPQTLTMDQGTSFTSGQVREFADSYKIKLLNSSLYYAHVNG